MTPAEVRDFVAAQPVPEGWSLTAVPVRVYRHRCKWAITARKAGGPAREYHAYNVRELMPAVLAWMASEDAPATVTTDATGHVVSIEDAA